MAFAPQPIENVLTSYDELFRKITVCLSFLLPIRDLYANSCSNHSRVHSIPSSYSNYNAASSPNSSKHFERSAFPLRLLGTRVVFPITQPIFSELETEAKVTFILLIKLIIGEADAGKHLAGWMRVAHEGDRAWVRLPSTVYLISPIGLLVTTRPSIRI
jgi:hypothetical protein